jgi:hypothetical protein
MGASFQNCPSRCKPVQCGENPLTGRRIHHSATLDCLSCHTRGAAGAQRGSDMSTPGAGAPLDCIIESVLNPVAVLLLYCVSRHRFVTKAVFFGAARFPGCFAPLRLLHPIC